MTLVKKTVEQVLESLVQRVEALEDRVAKTRSSGAIDKMDLEDLGRSINEIKESLAAVDGYVKHATGDIEAALEEMETLKVTVESLRLRTREATKS